MCACWSTDDGPVCVCVCVCVMSPIWQLEGHAGERDGRENGCSRRSGLFCLLYGGPDA